MSVLRWHRCPLVCLASPPNMVNAEKTWSPTAYPLPFPTSHWVHPHFCLASDGFHYPQTTRRATAQRENKQNLLALRGFGVASCLEGIFGL